MTFASSKNNLIIHKLFIVFNYLRPFIMCSIVVKHSRSLRKNLIVIYLDFVILENMEVAVFYVSTLM